MNLSSKVPKEIIVAAAAMLQPYCLDLTPVKLIDAIAQFDETEKQGAVYITLAAAAKKIGVSMPTIYRYIRDEKIAVKRLSRSKILVSENDLEKFINGVA